MSIAEIERFTKDVEENDELKKELAEAGTGQVAITAFANSKGYDFTAEEFQNAIGNEKGELSDEELETIAGGDIYGDGDNQYGVV